MNTKLLTVCALIFSFVFCGCSSSDSDEPRMPVEISVIGALGYSRVSGNTWENNDAIGISSETIINSKYVTADGSGIFKAAANAIKIADGATLSLNAYYPYSSSVNQSSRIISFTEPEDFLFAPTVSVSHSNPTANFTFSHCMTKITFVIKDAKNPSTLASGGTLTLSGVHKAGTFNTSTGIVAPLTEATSISGSFATDGVISFILPPKTTADQLGISVDYNGRTFSSEFDTPAYAAGTEYRYNVDVTYIEASASITVSAPSIRAWVVEESGDINLGQNGDDNGGDDSGTISYEGMKTGDFLLSDGSFLDKNSTTIPDNVAGIVIYVGNPAPSSRGECTEDEDILKATHPQAVHGIAVAINNANESAINITSSNHKNFNDVIPENSGYLSEFQMANGDTKPKSMSGFAFTRKIIEFSESSQSSTILQKFVSALRSYPAISIASASEWYVPSYPELDLIYRNMAEINELIEKCSGTKFESFSQDPARPAYSTGYYISSNFFLNENGTTIKNFSHHMNPDYPNNGDIASVAFGWLRPVIAF